MPARARTAIAAALLGAVAIGLAPASAAHADEMSITAYATSTGEHVRIGISTERPPAPETTQAWAEFFAELLHGPELAELTVRLVHPDETARSCDLFAAACYLPDRRLAIVAGASAPPTQGSFIAETARHEYGHHVATMRRNDPWPGELGTKRWFTAAGICEHLRRGSLVAFPDEGYARSSVEGFAEAYRVVSGGSPHGWLVADDYFPDAATRRALRLDITRPWRGNRTRVVIGRLAGGATRSHRLGVPLDGRVSATLTTPTADGARVQLLVRGARRASARGTPNGGRAATTVCGVRHADVVVSSREPTRYRLVVSLP